MASRARERFAFAPKETRTFHHRTDCDQCEFEYKKKTSASFYCRNCDIFLCHTCRNWHDANKDKETRHVVEEVEEAMSPSEPSEDGDICSIHRGRWIMYECRIHNTYCCVLCKKQEHKYCKQMVLIPRPRTAEFVKEFKVKMADDDRRPSITGSAFLKDSRLILADGANAKLKIFGPDHELLYDKKLKANPYNISLYRNEEVAVSLADEQKICRYSVDPPIYAKDEIRVGCFCRDSVYVDDDALLVLCPRDNIIKLLSIYHETLFTIRNSELDMELQKPCYCCLNAAKTKLYVSNVEGTVCGIDLSSKKIFFSQSYDNLVLPQGIVVDRDGNVYVCGSGSHNIHQLSPDGKHVGILLSQEDGIKSPWTMAFGPDGRTFVVASGDSKVAKLFKLVS